MLIVPENVAAASLPTKQSFASTIENIPSSAGSLNVSSSSNDNVKFGNVTINGSNIEITGSMGTGSSANFDLVGTLYDGIVSTRVDGVLTDKLHNFNVERFELLTDPQHSILINKNLTGEVLALYLEESGTRNVSFIECEASTVFSSQQISDISNASSNYLPAPKSASLWEETMFQPDSRAHNKVSNLSVNNLIVSPTPMTNSVPVSYIDAYSNSYEIFGYNVTDTIDVGYAAQEPNNDGGSITGTLSVKGYDLNESNGTDLKNVNTGFEIGAKSPGSYVILSVQSPTGITTEQFDGTVEHVGSGSISASVCWGIPYTPICLNLSFPSVSRKTIDGNGGGQTLTATQGSNTAAASIGSGSDYLQYIGDNLTAVWKIATQGTASAKNITANITYVYDLYNQNDNGGYDWGKQFDTLSWTMQS
jgi:hypothetical protein